MAISNSKIREVVDISIMELFNSFQAAPYSFLFESDIQSILYSKIKKKLPHLIEISGTGHPHEKYKVSVVHTEYFKKIDIACIDIEQCLSHPTRIHKGSDIHLYDLPILKGIEIKYRKLGDKFGIKSCILDMKKLENIGIKEPVILGFIQNDADVDDFFSACCPDIRFIEENKNSPLNIFTIVSPTRRWRIESKSIKEAT
ncbi:hypothetical protein [Shewanella frigidimarina]|uniref:Uncharacterized protein n=1 Tax=Shewanella frigidimarina TaxID=56812 RepID=A0A106BYS1_SHEFR|nr:hypothetical protein [Shewanella frigidimarina]KVX00979.1 hypothetical protein AWJ07_05830 [Shewanella frigidimarina]